MERVATEARESEAAEGWQPERLHKAHLVLLGFPSGRRGLVQVQHADNRIWRGTGEGCSGASAENSAKNGSEQTLQGDTRGSREERPRAGEFSATSRTALLPADVHGLEGPNGAQSACSSDKV